MVSDTLDLDHSSSDNDMMIRGIYLCLGLLMTTLGVIGAFVPVLPTTPFLLIACWAFGQSSPALANRLRNHPRFGYYLTAWETQRVIPLRAKWLASTMMSLAACYLVFISRVPIWASVPAVLLMTVGAVYIWSKPSRPRQLSDSAPTKTNAITTAADRS